MQPALPGVGSGTPVWATATNRGLTHYLYYFWGFVFVAMLVAPATRFLPCGRRWSAHSLCYAASASKAAETNQPNTAHDSILRFPNFSASGSDCPEHKLWAFNVKNCIVVSELYVEPLPYAKQYTPILQTLTLHTRTPQTPNPATLSLYRPN